MAKYDLAISFAGEQRPLARHLAQRLDSVGFSIFFDEFHLGEIWGTDLTISLSDAYAREARWCLVLVSEAYLRKPWTNIERQHALSRFMQERSGYLLCLKVDDSELPGLPAVIAYLDLRHMDLERVYGLLLEKLGTPSHENFKSTMSMEDTALAREVIQECFSRAIFTTMNGEISLQAMTGSIERTLGSLQKIHPKISNQSFQFGTLKIIKALDEIQRICTRSQRAFTYELSSVSLIKIDDLKRQVIRQLLDIRRAAALAIQLPFDLGIDHFWSHETADAPPSTEDWRYSDFFEDPAV